MPEKNDSWDPDQERDGGATACAPPMVVLAVLNSECNYNREGATCALVEQNAAVPADDRVRQANLGF